jgi:PAS domain S-box-containing protein
MVLRDDSPTALLQEDYTAWIEELRELRVRVAELESKVAESGREAEELFRSIADAAPVMLWMSGPDTLCTFFNKRWLKFRGRRMEQELGNGWAQGVHPDDLRRCMETYLKSFRGRQEFQMEYRLLRADGEYCWVVDSGVPRTEGKAGFAGYVGSAVEVHERARPVPENHNAARIPLTDREKQVLILVAEGKSTKEVAAALGISYKTADSHRTKIMDKLDLHETASLVRWAIRHNLVQP